MSLVDYPEPPPFQRQGRRVYVGDDLLASATNADNAELLVQALKALDTLYRCPVCKMFVDASAMPHHVTRHVTEAIVIGEHS